MKTKFKTGKSLQSNIVTSLAFGLCISFLFIVIFGLMLTQKDVSIKILPVFLILSGVFGTIVSSFIITKKSKLRGILSGLISGAAFSLLFLLIGFIVSGFHFSMKTLIILPVLMIASVITGILTRNLR